MTAEELEISVQRLHHSWSQNKGTLGKPVSAPISQSKKTKKKLSDILFFFINKQ
jgi:hypothetical protein